MNVGVMFVGGVKVLLMGARLRRSTSLVTSHRTKPWKASICDAIVEYAAEAKRECINLDMATMLDLKRVED